MKHYKFFASLFVFLFLISSDTLIAQSDTNSPFLVDTVAIETQILLRDEVPPVPSAWVSTNQGINYMLQHFGIEAQSDSAEWKASTLHFANSVLKTLPESFRKHAKAIVRVDRGRNSGVIGYVYMNEAPVIYITNRGTDYKLFQGYLVHEMTHCFQMGNPEILQKWEKQFWQGVWIWKSPKSSSVTSYGNSDPKEDMAESVRIYWENGPRLKREFPDRYEFIKNYVMGGIEY